MKKYLHEILTATLNKLNFPLHNIHFDKTKEDKFGDVSVNVAMTLAKELKLPPRKIAEEIFNSLELNNYDKNLISKVEIAGAGFINFFISDNYYKKIISTILSENDSYGKSDINKNKTANLEWVSANPTGLLHAGHGRQVCLGKAIANLLEWTGYKVTREYYYNDAGNQMATMAKSVYARYMQIFEPDFPFPEDGYVGDYNKEIAKKIYDEKKDSLKNSESLNYFQTEGENYNFNLIKKTLETLGVHHDSFFNESSLYESKVIQNTIEEFKLKGMTYEEDGAVWLKMNKDEGFQKDKVIVKSSGEPTYRLPDIAYHVDKINRGYDLIVDIFGSDHGDTYKEVLYGIKSLGYSVEKIKVIIRQMVTFKIGDESFKMSKRNDKSYYLDDLIKDIGADATQFFFIMRSANTHLDFDIELAKDHSEKNPVYYLQYAYARICGILRNADEHLPEYKSCDISKINTDLIKTEEEIKLLKVLSQFGEEVLTAALNYEPHKIITYLNEVAENFHRFYHNNRVVDIDNKELSTIRLLICLSAKQVLKNGFDIIGINAPERM
ncbi:MAG: arginine--tRNA ligase [Ignavibacteria bacterium]|nr:arginine--tRNA ligase [Ignavibacteria bacterium]